MGRHHHQRYRLSSLSGKSNQMRAKSRGPQNTGFLRWLSGNKRGERMCWRNNPNIYSRVLSRTGEAATGLLSCPQSP